MSHGAEAPAAAHHEAAPVPAASHDAAHAPAANNQASLLSTLKDRFSSIGGIAFMTLLGLGTLLSL